jgi:hypothetical protein
MSTMVRSMRWLVWLRRQDPLNVYLVLTSAGIGWVAALGTIFYRNPLTNNRTSVWGMISFSFIRSWIAKHPVGAAKMKLADLPEEQIAPAPEGGGGGRSQIKDITARFRSRYERRGRSSSNAIWWTMLPWWTFTHVLQIPRKFVQFLPPMLVSSLLNFLEDQTLPITVGYKLMALAALGMICTKAAQAQYLFSATNEGTQPAIMGCQAMILEKLQTMSPRARCVISSSEVQTIFQKMESFTSACTTPGQARMLLDMASMPLGYFFLYRLFGVPAIAVSIGANLGITALTTRVISHKTKTEAKLRELRKQQEGILHELAANLPIWKFYGWSRFFTSKLDRLTIELERVGRWNATCVVCFLLFFGAGAWGARAASALCHTQPPRPGCHPRTDTTHPVSACVRTRARARACGRWGTISYVLPSSIGPTAVLISVGINVLLGGTVELVKLLTAVCQGTRTLVHLCHPPAALPSQWSLSAAGVGRGRGALMDGRGDWWRAGFVHLDHHLVHDLHHLLPPAVEGPLHRVQEHRRAARAPRRPGPR